MNLSKNHHSQILALKRYLQQISADICSKYQFHVNQWGKSYLQQISLVNNEWTNGEELH